MESYDSVSPQKCVFCSFTVPTRNKFHTWELLQHIEYNHPDKDGSPFVVRSRPRSEECSRSPRLPVPHSSNSPVPELQLPLHSPMSREGSSRSRGSTPSSNPEGDYYVECLLEECGEAVHIRELDQHMELHDIEMMEMNYSEHSHSRDTSPSPRRRSSPGQQPVSKQHIKSVHTKRTRHPNRLSVPSSSRPNSTSPSRYWPGKRTFDSLKTLFLGPAPRKTRTSEAMAGKGRVKRLGKQELGPYAFEKQMPSWLRKQLESGPGVMRSDYIGQDGHLIRTERAYNEVPGIIPVLAGLCQSDRSLYKVFLCHPAVKHIFKMPREGGFCGYRNIQMLVSFLQVSNFPGAQHFPGKIPSILRLQDLIEEAWDKGFDPDARIQTGGIKGTRKYIGTPEVQAMFSNLGVGHDVNAFSGDITQLGDRDYVHDAVVEAVLEYFSSGVASVSGKVYQTGMAPIYFQHPGHSMTIVGLEVRKSRNMNLLVFDPMFRTPAPLLNLTSQQNYPSRPKELLSPFRRGNADLRDYTSFEILKLTSPPNTLPGFQRLSVR